MLMLLSNIAWNFERKNLKELTVSVAEGFGKTLKEALKIAISVSNEKSRRRVIKIVTLNSWKD